MIIVGSNNIYKNVLVTFSISNFKTEYFSGDINVGKILEYRINRPLSW